MTQKVHRREQYTCTDLHVRESAEGKYSRTIEGYAILFNTPSEPLWSDESEEAREIISPEAITRSLLDTCDIKMTMFHDRQLILARSRQGSGTLSYEVDDKGVSFEFEAPNTVDGDKALELVRRGEISGCSFAFATPYFDPEYVERTEVKDAERSYVTYRVKKVVGVYDFTLAADPAYSQTSCDVRELREKPMPAPAPETPNQSRAQVKEMREAANQKIIY